jgi:hypothetical protein
MKRYYCTYFDRHYLVKAIVLMDSLNEHEKNDFEVFAICLDELSRTLLRKLQIPNVTPVALHEFEGYDRELLHAKYNRELKEYYFTLTPTLILRLLERYPHIDAITYLDADQLFFASPDPVFEEFSRGSVLIQPHRFPRRLKHLAIYGRYNVGLLVFRNDQNGRRVLQWWRERCNEWCYAKAENGKYADQRYLDCWIDRFEGIVEIENVGIGLGPWNQDQYSYRRTDSGQVLVDQKELILYHFHSLTLTTPEIITPATSPHYHYKIDILKFCVIPYVRKLRAAIPHVRALLPGFSFGLGNNTLLQQVSLVVHKAAEEDIRSSGLRLTRVECDELWDAYCTDQVVDLPEISKQEASLVRKIDSELSCQPRQF